MVLALIRDIVAWVGLGVCDGRHNLDVMKKVGSLGVIPVGPSAGEVESTTRYANVYVRNRGQCGGAESSSGDGLARSCQTLEATYTLCRRM